MKPPAGSVFPETPASRSDAAVSPSPARAPNPLAAALGGNRCGHVPSAPRFALTLPPQANPARPALIAKAVGKLREYYRTPREGRWDALSQAERQARLNRPRPAAGGSDPEDGRRAQRRARWRQQRSERREALVAVIGLLLYYTDIRTLTVAVPRGGDWLGLSGPWIARHTGLSASRVKRALATLARSAWLVNTGRGRQFDRRRRCWVGAGWGPVRRLSFRLIRALGLDVSWRQAQRKARRSDARAPVLAAGSQTAPPPTEIPALARPAPAPGAARETQREHARALRQALASPAARRAEADPAGHHAGIERQRRLAEWAAEGLSLAEARQRLNDTPQPP